MNAPKEFSLQDLTPEEYLEVAALIRKKRDSAALAALERESREAKAKRDAERDAEIAEAQAANRIVLDFFVGELKALCRKYAVQVTSGYDGDPIATFGSGAEQVTADLGYFDGQ
jgi:membrane protein involved in colicin uptake